MAKLAQIPANTWRNPRSWGDFLEERRLPKLQRELGAISILMPMILKWQTPKHIFIATQCQDIYLFASLHSLACTVLCDIKVLWHWSWKICVLIAISAQVRKTACSAKSIFCSASYESHRMSSKSLWSTVISRLLCVVLPSWGIFVW